MPHSHEIFWDRFEWALRTAIAIVCPTCVFFLVPGFTISIFFAAMVAIVATGRTLGQTLKSAWNCNLGTVLAAVVNFVIIKVVGLNGWWVFVITIFCLSFWFAGCGLHPLAKKNALAINALVALRFVMMNETNFDPSLPFGMCLTVLFGTSCSIGALLLPFPRLATRKVNHHLNSAEEKLSSVFTAMIRVFAHRSILMYPSNLQNQQQQQQARRFSPQQQQQQDHHQTLEEMLKQQHDILAERQELRKRENEGLREFHDQQQHLGFQEHLHSHFGNELDLKDHIFWSTWEKENKGNHNKSWKEKLEKRLHHRTSSSSSHHHGGRRHGEEQEEEDPRHGDGAQSEPSITPRDKQSDSSDASGGGGGGGGVGAGIFSPQSETTTPRRDISPQHRSHYHFSRGHLHRSRAGRVFAETIAHPNTPVSDGEETEKQNVHRSWSQPQQHHIENGATSFKRDLSSRMETLAATVNDEKEKGNNNSDIEVRRNHHHLIFAGGEVGDEDDLYSGAGVSGGGGGGEKKIQQHPINNGVYVNGKLVIDLNDDSPPLHNGLSSSSSSHAQQQQHQPALSDSHPPSSTQEEDLTKRLSRLPSWELERTEAIDWATLGWGEEQQRLSALNVVGHGSSTVAAWVVRIEQLQQEIASDLANASVLLEDAAWEPRQRGMLERATRRLELLKGLAKATKGMQVVIDHPNLKKIKPELLHEMEKSLFAIASTCASILNSSSTEANNAMKGPVSAAAAAASSAAGEATGSFSNRNGSNINARRSTNSTTENDDGGGDARQMEEGGVPPLSNELLLRLAIDDFNEHLAVARKASYVSVDSMQTLQKANQILSGAVISNYFFFNVLQYTGLLLEESTVEAEERAEYEKKERRKNRHHFNIQTPPSTSTTSKTRRFSLRIKSRSRPIPPFRWKVYRNILFDFFKSLVFVPHWKSNKTRRALKIAVAILLASLQGGIVVSRPFGYWAPTTIGFIAGSGQPFGGSFSTSVQRLCGTIFGAVFSYIIVSETNRGALAIGIALSCWCLVCGFVRSSVSWSYTAVVAAFTAPLIMLIDTANVQGIVLARIEESVIGISILIAVDMLILPERASTIVHDEVLGALKDCHLAFGTIWRNYLGESCDRCARKAEEVLEERLASIVRHLDIAEENITAAKAEPEFRVQYQFRENLYTEAITVMRQMQAWLSTSAIALERGDEMSDAIITEMLDPLRVSFELYGQSIARVMGALKGVLAAIHPSSRKSKRAQHQAMSKRVCCQISADETNHPASTPAGGGGGGLPTAMGRSSFHVHSAASFSNSIPYLLEQSAEDEDGPPLPQLPSLGSGSTSFLASMFGKGIKAIDSVPFVENYARSLGKMHESERMIDTQYVECIRQCIWLRYRERLPLQFSNNDLILFNSLLFSLHALARDLGHLGAILVVQLEMASLSTPGYEGDRMTEFVTAATVELPPDKIEQQRSNQTAFPGLIPLQGGGGGGGVDSHGENNNNNNKSNENIVLRRNNSDGDEDDDTDDRVIIASATQPSPVLSQRLGAIFQSVPSPTKRSPFPSSSRSSSQMHSAGASVAHPPDIARNHSSSSTAHSPGSSSPSRMNRMGSTASSGTAAGGREVIILSSNPKLERNVSAASSTLGGGGGGGGGGGIFGRSGSRNIGVGNVIDQVTARSQSQRQAENMDDDGDEEEDEDDEEAGGLLSPKR